MAQGIQGGNGGVIIVPPDSTGGQPASAPGAPEYGLDYVPSIDFAVKDPTVIQHEVINDYEAAFKLLTGIAKSLAPGDPVRLHLLVVCHWLSHQRTLIDFTGKNNLLKYARGDYLDNLAALHGQRALRLPAHPASCTLRFTLEHPLAFDASIPWGTQCQAPNGIIFQTLTAGTIKTGEFFCDVSAQALDAGVIGNGFVPGQVNTIINWNQQFAMEVSNTDTTDGGSDEETDNQYRYRVWLAIESYSTCGPRAAYEFWALSAHPDISQCVVYSAPDIAGEVHLYPLLKGGQIPSQSILDMVLAKCSADTVRPLTDYVTAYAPTPFIYTLNMTYYVSKDNEVVQSSISVNVNQAVSDWILWQRSYVGRDLNCDELIRRCLEAGAKRIDVTSPMPLFQLMQYNQLACHDEAIAPVVTYGGVEEP
jgi:phage-related baseplate assembly protein